MKELIAAIKDALPMVPHKDVAYCHRGFEGGQDRCAYCQRIIKAWDAIRELERMNK